MPIHETLLKEATFALDLDLLTKEMRSARRLRTYNAAARARARSLAEAMSRSGYPKISEFWKTRRLTVNLQLRLYVEAVLFSMGQPWSDLVSGFKPLRVNLGGWNPSPPKKIQT